jgi:hypothetical protein
LPSPPPKTITEQYLILGEGDGDEAFFRYFCDVRHIAGFGYDAVSGNKDFERYLRAIASLSPAPRSVLIVADNDETPDANFKNVQKQIDKAKYPQPSAPLRRATKPEFPDIVVLMLPYPSIGNSSHGALETLLLPAAERHLPGQTLCVDQYSRCIYQLPPQWTRTESDKMRLRCLLSGSSNTDANIALRHALKPLKNLIPLTDPLFDPIEQLLTHFARWMDSPQANWDDYKTANGL